jgi:hypothetical protein
MALILMNDMYGINMSGLRPRWGCRMFYIHNIIARCTMLLTGAPLELMSARPRKISLVNFICDRSDIQTNVQLTYLNTLFGQPQNEPLLQRRRSPPKRLPQAEQRRGRGGSV